MEWFKIFCQCFAIIACYEFCHAVHEDCLEINIITIQAKPDDYSLKNGRKMELCKYVEYGYKMYRIQVIDTLQEICTFEYSMVDDINTYDKSVNFTFIGPDYRANIECKFVDKSASIEFLNEIRSIVKTYSISKVVQYWPDFKDKKPLTLAKPAELYIKTIGNEKIINISSILTAGQQKSFYTNAASRFALSEVTRSRILCLCTEDSMMVHLLYFSNSSDVQQFINEDVGPQTNRAIECNFPEEALQLQDKSVEPF